MLAAYMYIPMYVRRNERSLGDTYLKSWMTEFFEDFFFSMVDGGSKKNTIILTKAQKEPKKKSMIH